MQPPPSIKSLAPCLSGRESAFRQMSAPYPSCTHLELPFHQPGLFIGFQAASSQTPTFGNRTTCYTAMKMRQTFELDLVVTEEPLKGLNKGVTKVMPPSNTKSDGDKNGSSRLQRCNYSKWGQTILWSKKWTKSEKLGLRCRKSQVLKSPLHQARSLLSSDINLSSSINQGREN